MKQYLITISSYLPYPVKKEFRINGSSMATASARAIRSYRKEVGKKKISDLTVSIKTIGKVEKTLQISENNSVTIVGYLPEVLAH